MTIKTLIAAVGASTILAISACTLYIGEPGSSPAQPWGPDAAGPQVDAGDPTVDADVDAGPCCGGPDAGVVPDATCGTGVDAGGVDAGYDPPAPDAAY
jgi:hypothetical protein